MTGLYLHLLHLFKDKEAGHGYMADVMPGRGFDGDYVAHLKPQIIDIAVKTLACILKPDFDHFIVPGVKGQACKPVEFIKLVCARCCILLQVLKVLQPACDLYIFVCHYVTYNISRMTVKNERLPGTRMQN